MSLIVTSTKEEGFTTLRQKARTQLAGLDFPAIKDEEWKYTRIGKLKSKNFNIDHKPAAVNIDTHLYSEATSRMVFVNGFFDQTKSFIKSAFIQRTAEVSEAVLESALSQTGYIKNSLFTSYNDAFFTDGIFVDIPEGKSIEGVVEIVFVSTGQQQASVIKNVFLCGKNTRATFLFTFIGADATDNLVNHTLHAAVNNQSHVELFKLQHEVNGVSHFSSENIFQHSQSDFGIHTITLYGDLVRNDLNIKVDGEHCHTHLGGVFIADGNMHVDNHTLVDHQKPNCESNEQYKGIAKDHATGVFNGKIFVRRDAQKINAYQNSANVLLSDDANVYTKPELEIYADDVKCSHGTTTGCLDEEALFYLRARGISEESARNLLVHAFAADVLEKIENEEMRDWFIQKLDERLNDQA